MVIDAGTTCAPALAATPVVTIFGKSWLLHVTEVLGATSFYDDEDFAAMRLNGGDFMFHADHTYRDNPLIGVVADLEGRGAGVELRLYGCDPDAAEPRARALGYTVLAGSMDKPHGLRECLLM